MGKTYLTVDNFDYIGNIANTLSPAYRFTCQQSFIYQILANEPGLMKLTTGETQTTIDTSVDFDVIATYPATIYQKSTDGTIVYEKMAVAYDHTTATISKAVAFDEATNTFTFSALSGGGSHTVSIFYLLNEGLVRFQLVGAGSNIVTNRGIFEGDIGLLNGKDQVNSEELMYYNVPVDISDAMKLEISVQTSAPIYLDSRDLVTGMSFNCAPSIIRIPVNYKRSTDVENVESANLQLNK